MSIVGTDYTSLDHRVIDAAIASRVCGWTKRKHANGATRFYSPETWTYLDRLFETGHPDGFKWEPCHTEEFDTTHDARYSTDYNAVHEALGKLTDAQFANFTWVLVNARVLAENIPDWSANIGAQVAFRATPRQICEAILEALDKEAAQ